MQLRDELLNSLMKEAGSKCKMVVSGQNYPALLQKLIVQGLIKIEEMEVIVYCRGEDVATVTKILPKAVDEYVEIMERVFTVSRKISSQDTNGTSRYVCYIVSKSKLKFLKCPMLKALLWEAGILFHNSA